MGKITKKAALSALLVFLSFVAYAYPPPVITAQPQDTNVVNGGTAYFSVTASSPISMNYQWYKDGLLVLDQVLTGETRSYLVISNVSSSDEGAYFVKVSNAGGTVTSRKAALTLVPNNPPVANNDNYTTTEDTPLLVPAGGVLINDTDPNGQPMVAVLYTNVMQGNLVFNNNGSFGYMPPSNFFGSVSFAYRVSDNFPSLIEENPYGGVGRQISVGAKSAQSFKHGTAGGPSYMITKLVFYLSRRSGGTGNMYFNVGTGTNSGVIAGSGVSIPATNVTDTSDGFTFQTYSINYDVPIGPFAAGTTYFLNFDNQATERFYVEWPNANTYANGSYFEGGVNQGKDMRFQVHETVMSSPATVTINVTPINDAPVAVNDFVTMPEDVTTNINVLANDYDVDGPALTVSGASTTIGTATIVAAGTRILYKPPTNYYGPAIIYYTISDGTLSASASVTVNVTPVNDPPVANDDSYTVAEDNVLAIPGSAPSTNGIKGGVLANDTDVEGDVLTALLVSTVSHGKLQLNENGSFNYTPDPDFNGIDSFTYSAFDGSATSAPATVTINVTPVPDQPTIADQRMMPDGFQLRITGIDAPACVIWASTDLQNWTPISTNSAYLGSLTFTDPTAANYSMRFYKVCGANTNGY